MHNTYAAQAVYVEYIDNAAAGIKINGPNGAYIKSAKPIFVCEVSTRSISVIRTISQRSDKRFKIIVKSNALDVIDILEPIEYEQTHNLVNNYTPVTTQSHHCGFIAQSVQQTDQLKHSLVGGEIGDDGQATIISLKYKTLFTYAVKSIQELNDVVQKQQEQIDAPKATY